VEEAPPPAPAVEDEAPKVKKGQKPKQGNGEEVQPGEVLPPVLPPPPPPPPPQEEAVPLPPSPPVSEEAPKPHKQGNGKFKKGNGEQSQPDEAPEQQMMPPPAPPQEEAAPPPPSGDAPPGANQKNGNGKPKKGHGEAPAPCPEGMVPLDDGSCATPQ
jgi:hypothetical protein